MAIKLINLNSKAHGFSQPAKQAKNFTGKFKNSWKIPEFLRS